MSSLEILQPRTIEYDKQPNESSTSWYLKQLTRQLLEHVNIRDWSHPDWNEYIDPDVEVYIIDKETKMERRPRIKGRDEFIVQYKEFVDAYPKYYCEPVTISASTNCRGTTAMVWAVLRVYGSPPNMSVCRESVVVSEWRKKASGWVGVKQTSMRGIGSM